jgi:hypothetical protein
MSDSGVLGQGGEVLSPPNLVSTNAFPAINGANIKLSKRELEVIKSDLSHREMCEKMEAGNSPITNNSSPASHNAEPSTPIEAQPEACTSGSPPHSEEPSAVGEKSAVAANNTSPTRPPSSSTAAGRVAIKNQAQTKANQKGLPSKQPQGNNRSTWQGRGEAHAQRNNSNPWQPTFSEKWQNQEKWKDSFNFAVAKIHAEQTMKGISNVYIHVCVDEHTRVHLSIGDSIENIGLPDCVIADSKAQKDAYVKAKDSEKPNGYAVVMNPLTQYAAVYVTAHANGMDPPTTNKMLMFATSDALFIGGGPGGQRGRIDLKFGAPNHNVKVLQKSSPSTMMWHCTGLGASTVSARIAASYCASLQHNAGISKMIAQSLEEATEVYIQVPDSAKSILNLGQIAKMVSTNIGEIISEKLKPVTKPKFERGYTLFQAEMHTKPENKAALQNAKIPITVYHSSAVGDFCQIVTINVMTKEVFEAHIDASNTPVQNETMNDPVPPPPTVLGEPEALVGVVPPVPAVKEPNINEPKFYTPKYNTKYPMPKFAKKRGSEDTVDEEATDDLDHTGEQRARKVLKPTKAKSQRTRTEGNQFAALPVLVEEGDQDIGMTDEVLELHTTGSEEGSGGSVDTSGNTGVHISTPPPLL